MTAGAWRCVRQAPAATSTWVRLRIRDRSGPVRSSSGARDHERAGRQSERHALTPARPKSQDTPRRRRPEDGFSAHVPKSRHRMPVRRPGHRLKTGNAERGIVDRGLVVLLEVAEFLLGTWRRMGPAKRRQCLDEASSLLGRQFGRTTAYPDSPHQPASCVTTLRRIGAWAHAVSACRGAVRE
jgi:hypothetical protein